MRASGHATEEWKQREVTVDTQSFDRKFNDNFIGSSFSYIYELIDDI